jgi:TRAP-type uncharacterized transport system fused permease subunit
MRLGSIIYFIPFFFVLEPALIMSGNLGQTVFATLEVAVGIIFIAGSLQHYVLGIGFLDKKTPLAIFGRVLTGFGGGLIALPSLEVIGLEVASSTLLMTGFGLGLIGISLSLRKRNAEEN